ncbi:MAG: thiamine phosphate synthase, partial [Candidatus Omnitrophica bacterium]|nr:thiamine phosphate synthase [Candidatus Omnitrophota bacterium]
MLSKKKLLKESRLYLILDKDTWGRRSLLAFIRGMPRDTIDMVQLRDKHSRKTTILNDSLILRKWLKKTKIPFIINDHIDIAKMTESDGVHLGQTDTPIHIARKILGRDKIIGISCHNLREAFEAEKNGADYIGIGPTFPTSTKPDADKPIDFSIPDILIKNLRIPFFVIGGITHARLPYFTPRFRRIAVCSAILNAKDPCVSAR